MDLCCEPHKIFINVSILSEIFKNFSPAQWLTLRLVSKLWCDVVESEFQRLEILDIEQFVIESAVNELPPDTISLADLLPATCSHSSLVCYKTEEENRVMKLICWISSRCPNVRTLKIGRFFAENVDVVPEMFSSFKKIESLELNTLYLRTIPLSSITNICDSLLVMGSHLRKITLRRVFTGQSPSNAPFFFDDMLASALTEMTSLETLEITEAHSLLGRFLHNIPEVVKLRSLVLEVTIESETSVLSGFLSSFLRERGDRLQELFFSCFCGNMPAELIASIATLSKHLTKLGLGIRLSHYNPQDIAPLSDLVNIEHLVLNIYQQDHALPVLMAVSRNCWKLTIVHINYCHFLFRRNDIEFLKQLHRLEELYLADNEHLLPHLQFNVQRGILAPRKFFGLLGILPNLRSLNLCSHGFMMTDFSPLSHFDSLESISVTSRYPSYVTAHLPPAIRNLSLFDCTAEEIGRIPSAVGKNLEQLRVPVENFSNVSFVEAVAERCPNLEKLEAFGQCETKREHLIINGIKEIVKNCGNLKHLTVCHKLKILLIRDSFFKAVLSSKFY